MLERILCNFHKSEEHYTILRNLWGDFDRSSIKREEEEIKELKML